MTSGIFNTTFTPNEFALVHVAISLKEFGLNSGMPLILLNAALVNKTNAVIPIQISSRKHPHMSVDTSFRGDAVTANKICGTIDVNGDEIEMRIEDDKFSSASKKEFIDTFAFLLENKTIFKAELRLVGSVRVEVRIRPISNVIKMTPRNAIEC
jgi:hypothetical protein